MRWQIRLKGKETRENKILECIDDLRDVNLLRGLDGAEITVVKQPGTSSAG